MSYKLHTIETAPEEAKGFFEDAKKVFGFVPNLYAVLAEAPGTLKSYKYLHQQFLESSLTNEEKTVVWQTINRLNECHYCVPAHTGIAYSMNIDESIIKALVAGDALEDPKLEALRIATTAMVENRGHLSQEEQQAFFDAGYGHRQLLEIVMGMAQKVISNYTNHLADTPVDDAFKKFI